MSKWIVLTLRENDPGFDAYLKRDLARDSTFPFDADEELVAHITDCGTVHLIPRAELAKFVGSPITVDAPPPAAVPSDPDHAAASVDAEADTSSPSVLADPADSDDTR